MTAFGYCDCGACLECDRARRADAPRPPSLCVTCRVSPEAASGARLCASCLSVAATVHAALNIGAASPSPARTAKPMDDEALRATIKAIPHEQAIGILMTGATDEQWKELAVMAGTLMCNPAQFVWDPSKAQSNTPRASPSPNTTGGTKP